MTSKEFVIWLQGFTEGVHQYNITPMQWDILKAKLAEVNDEQPIGVGGMGVPNTQPFPRWQEPHTYYPNVEIPCINPNGTVPSPGFVVTTTPGTTITTTPNGTGGSSGVITTTPGSGSITISNPLFGFGSTSTTYGYPSGSAWSYTNTGYNPPYTTGEGLDDMKIQHNED